MLSTTYRADSFGAAASFLCMIHCLATPFLFVAQTCAKSCCGDAPGWWRAIDFLFLVISFMAISQAMRTSSVKWVWRGLWLAWLALGWSVLMEALVPTLFFPGVKYTAASALIGLHFYNMKYCKCGTPNCEVHYG